MNYGEQNLVENTIDSNSDEKQIITQHVIITRKTKDNSFFNNLWSNHMLFVFIIIFSFIILIYVLKNKFKKHNMKNH